MVYLNDFNGTVTLNNCLIQNNTGMYTRDVRERILTNHISQSVIRSLDGKRTYHFLKCSLI